MDQTWRRDRLEEEHVEDYHEVHDYKFAHPRTREHIDEAWAEHFLWIRPSSDRYLRRYIACCRATFQPFVRIEPGKTYARVRIELFEEDKAVFAGEIDDFGQGWLPGGQPLPWRQRADFIGERCKRFVDLVSVSPPWQPRQSKYSSYMRAWGVNSYCWGAPISLAPRIAQAWFTLATDLTVTPEQLAAAYRKETGF